MSIEVKKYPKDGNATGATENGNVSGGGSGSGGGGRDDAPTISALSNALSMCHFGAPGLSNAGTEYYKRIKETLSKENIPIEIQTRLLNVEDTSVVVFFSHGAAVALVMAETYTNMNEEPVAAICPAVETSVSENIEGIEQVMNVIVVDEGSYTRAENMASWIFNLIIPKARPEAFEKITIEGFGKEGIMSIETSDRANNAYQNICPVTPARNSLTMVISHTKKQKGGLDFGNKNATKSEPLAYVAAYVEFIYNQNWRLAENQKKYTPIIHITEILPVIAKANQLTYIIPSIVDTLIKKRQWKKQFMDFGKKGAANIGNLLGIIDDKLFAVESTSELEDLMNMYVGDPSLVFDVSAGRPMIPGLASLVNSTQKELISEFRTFTGKDIPVDTNIGSLAYNEIGGTINMNGEYLDSRYIDYLSLAPSFAKNSNNLSALDFLLRKSNDPMEQIKKIESVTGTVNKLWIHNCAMVHPGFVQLLLNSIVSDLEFNTINMEQRDGLDTASFINQSSGLSGINGTLNVHGGGFSSGRSLGSGLF